MLYAKTTQCTKTKRGGGELRKYLHNHKITILIVPTARRVSERSDRALQSDAKPSTMFQSTNKPRRRQGKQRRPKKKHKFTLISWVCLISYLRFRPSFRLNCLKNHDDCPHSHPWMFSCASSPRGPALVRFPPVLSLSAGIEIDRARASAGERRGGCICTRGCDSKPSVLPSHKTNRDAHIMRFQNAV